MSYSIVKEQSPLSRRKAKKQKVMILEEGERVKEERAVFTLLTTGDSTQARNCQFLLLVL
jgi:hypothetical protein